MPAVSKKQQKFFGIVRAIQKGEQVPNTPETAKAAADMKKGDVKKFASTKHKGLPEKKVTKEESNIYNEGSLHKWFKGSKSKDGKPGWVNVKTGGTCASDEPGEGTPKCVSSAKRASMSKSERESASRRKKAADPNQQSKTGAAKPTYVSTDKPKKKVSEAMNFSKFKARAMDAAKKAVAKKSVSKKSSSSYVGQRDAGAIAAKRMRDKEQQKYVGFLPANESVSEAKQEGGYISNAAKAEVRNERRFGKKGSATPTGTFGQGTSEKAKLAVKRGEEHKARRGVKTKGMKEEAYTGPDKEDRKIINKMYDKKGNKTDFAKKAAEYEKNMDPKKRQALKDKATKGMKFTHEGTSYGLYKGSGKPSGAMAAFAKNDKDKKKKEVKKEEVVIESDKKGKGSGTKDACYHKVKSRYSVWPSAYASGALVKCRKKGAANWGNSKKEEFSDWKSEFIWEDGDSVKKPVDEMFGGSSSGGRADRGDEVGRKERVKKAQEAKAKRAAVKDTPIDKYKGSPAYQRMMAKMKKEEFVSEKKIEEGKSPAWQRKEGKSESGGLNQKGVASYRAANPGSKLKTAVTTKPSKLKKGSKAANRRKSFCSRMKGMKAKLTSAKTARDPDSRINKSLRKWNC